MDKESLNREISHLKSYLQDLQSRQGKMSPDELKTVSYTLTGIIVTINSYMSTGAFGMNKEEEKDLFETFDRMRNVALHYGYFDSKDHIKSIKENVLPSLPDRIENNFADLVNTNESINSDTYLKIDMRPRDTIKDAPGLDGYYEIQLDGKDSKLYVRKEDLIKITGTSGVLPSFLIKNSDDERFLLKVRDEETQKYALSELLALGEDFAKRINSAGEISLKLKLSKILQHMKDNPYQNIKVDYNDADGSATRKAYDVINDILNNHEISIKFLQEQYRVSDFEDTNYEDYSSTRRINVYNMVDRANLYDAFFLELFVKRYQDYKKALSTLPYDENRNYTRQALILDMFSMGFKNLSNDFIDGDRNHQFADLYYSAKRARNALAHGVLNDEEKEKVLDTAEEYIETLYDVFSRALHGINKKMTNDLNYTLGRHMNKSDGTTVVHGKHDAYFIMNHNGDFRMIEGKKYVCIDNSGKDPIYLETGHNTPLLFGYGKMCSTQILAPKQGARFVKIDSNGNIIPTRINERILNTTICDNKMAPIISAMRYLKLHPQMGKKGVGPRFPAITYFDKNGNAMCTEKVKNLLIRGVKQRVVPTELTDDVRIVISPNRNDPIQVVNSRGQTVAVIYLACAETVKGKEVLKHLLTNGQTEDIDCGTILPKDLKIDSMTVIRRRN